MLNIRSIFLRVFRFIRISLSGSSWRRKAIILSSENDGTRLNKSMLHLSKFDLCIPMNTFEFVLDGYSHLDVLKSKSNFSFAIKNNSFFAENEFFNFEINSCEELFILSEIFVSGDYDFRLADDVVVIDVGANVGLASLFFASKQNVKKIYSYEPFSPTYKDCLNNLSRNSLLADKISIHNYGLADRENTLDLEYSYENKGQVGINGVDLIRSSMTDRTVETIDLKPISLEFGRIAVDYPDTDIVMKIDCEGGEYAIFDYFDESGIPGSVKLIMMEWHGSESDRLLNVLNDNKFTCIFTADKFKDVGMIYAFR